MCIVFGGLAAFSMIIAVGLGYLIYRIVTFGKSTDYQTPGSGGCYD